MRAQRPDALYVEGCDGYDAKSCRQGHQVLDDGAHLMPTPVLVTGSIRSGSTWVGRMLCLSGQLGYIHEPFNPWRWPGWAAERFPHELVYVNSENEATYYPVLRDVINMRFPLIRHLPQIREPRHVWRLARDWGRAFAIHGPSTSRCSRTPTRFFRPSGSPGNSTCRW